MLKLLPLIAAAVLAGGCSAADWMNALTPREGRRYSDIAYCGRTGLKLDVYTPRDERDAPVLVFFYPGRWSYGSKADFRFVAEGLVARGFVVVIPDYRHYPAFKYPSFLEDAATAVVWTRQNIDRYGGNAADLFVMGHSSGAYNAAMITLDDQWLRNAGGSRQWLRGMIGLSGPYDFPVDVLPEIKGIFGEAPVGASQPIDFVDGTNPPLLLLHGEDDLSVGVDNTHSLARKVAGAGGRVETVIYSNLDHGYMAASLSPSVRFRSSPLEFIERFVRENSARGRAG
ncbi:MAG TPA: alpha/beta hydrolase [Candidatus Limnocylindrales bacterium]|nr:alpha/beta hydrolase [Candidatus Limnocylindrales bacterium]